MITALSKSLSGECGPQILTAFFKSNLIILSYLNGRTELSVLKLVSRVFELQLYIVWRIYLSVTWWTDFILRVENMHDIFHDFDILPGISSFLTGSRVIGIGGIPSFMQSGL